MTHPAQPFDTAQDEMPSEPLYIQSLRARDGRTQKEIDILGCIDALRAHCERLVVEREGVRASLSTALAVALGRAESAESQLAALREEVIEEIAKEIDRIAGNDKDFDHYQRRGAGRIAAFVRALAQRGKG